MAGLTAIPEMIAAIGASAKATVADLAEAVDTARDLRESIDAVHVSAGMTKASDGAVDTKKLGAALQSLTRRS